MPLPPLPPASVRSGHCRHCRQLPPLPLAVPAAARHGRPGASAATLVGGRGSGDRGNPGRACHNPHGTFLKRPQGRDGPHAKGALGLGDPLRPGGASIRGGTGSGLERVTIVRLGPDGSVFLMHSLFFVRVNVYSTQRRLFACLGELDV